MVKLIENILCISRDGKRLGYRRKRKLPVVKYEHTFQLRGVHSDANTDIDEGAGAGAGVEQLKPIEEKQIECFTCKNVCNDRKCIEHVQESSVEHIQNVIQRSKHECPVCCSEIQGNFYVTQCNHIFHLECIVPWYTRQNTCPLCRETDIKLPINVTLL